jgi:hypothetical protein
MCLPPSVRGFYSLIRSLALKNLKLAVLAPVLLFCIVGYAQNTLPDTPAGTVLRAWLDAFNSGDRTKIEAYIKTYDPQKSVERMMGFFSQTGGFDLLSIESSEPLLIRFRVKEKASPTVGIGSLQLKSNSTIVENFGLRAIPPGAVVENVKVDAPARQRLIDEVVKNLNEFYVYPDLAQKMADAIRASQKRGDYDAIADPDTFANRLTKDLQAVSHDQHLNVNYSPIKLPPDEDKPDPEQEAQFKKMLERTNCTFQKVEILARNVGYLKFDAFPDPTFCGATVVAAMNFSRTWTRSSSIFGKTVEVTRGWSRWSQAICSTSRLT